MRLGVQFETGSIVEVRVYRASAVSPCNEWVDFLHPRFRGDFLMQAKYVLGAAVCGVLVVAAGCRKTNMVDKMAFKSAINNYYSSRQECVWPDTKKFPAQADTTNDEQTKGYDALTDAGLLVRQSAEKKRFLIGSKQVNIYDLSDKGRSSWTADQTQPGYGNFCYGHREATTIDSYTPSDTAEAAQYSVNYHYDVANVPGWAASTEMKSAFANVAADTSGQQTATATPVKSNSGWQVTAVQPLGGATLPQ
jgi:outer membrane murein-binding lipoprotein Lpp